MIRDLFSHKIHSSTDTWPDKLTELAAIFAEFDGHLYDRDALEDRLSLISPRASYLAENAAMKPRLEGGRLDVSKFRDEISAYPAYLGLYFIEESPYGWVLRVSETAKRFLICEEPDVASFLRLQLPLFQYPNAMGAAYNSFTNYLRIQANVRDRTLDFIDQGIHLSPMRLVALALQADAQLRGVNILQACASFDEIFGLANVPQINQHALPPIESVTDVLDAIRAGYYDIPDEYENRFHILRHTEMFLLSRSDIRLRQAVNEVDREQLLQQFNAICTLESQFDGFDGCTTGGDIEDVIASGLWGQYFDGVKLLSSDVVEVLTDDRALESSMPLETEEADEPLVFPKPIAEIYPFRERTRSLPTVKPYDRRYEMADPELTRIKRQRRTLAHKELIAKMDNWLRSIGATPKENEHVDLFAKIPHDGSFIFEMKSGGESLLEQIRKGISQLYEYRYRYRTQIDDPSISLCLVLPEAPSMPWMTDYLCNDREINICWFEGEDKLVWPDLCEEQMRVLAIHDDA